MYRWMPPPHGPVWPGVYASGMSILERKDFQRNALRFRQLDDLAKRLAALEKALQERES